MAPTRSHAAQKMLILWQEVQGVERPRFKRGARGSLEKKAPNPSNRIPEEFPRDACAATPCRPRLR